MEVLSKVEFTKEEIYQIVKKTNGCIVWGGSVNIAPADDILIHVERELSFESFDKIVVSIMAKKIAFGSNHVVIDIPYGPSVKVHTKEDAEIVKQKFEYIAGKFDIHIAVLIHEVDQPAGRGIGPIMETRDSLRVLEQTSDRPVDLEKHAVLLAGTLLELCADHDEKKQELLHKQHGSGKAWATDLLESGKAWMKMKEIIEAQGGNGAVSSTSLTLKLARHTCVIKAERQCTVKSVDSKNCTAIARILGCPNQKGAGIYLNKKIGEVAEKGDVLFTLYSENLYNLKEAQDSLNNFPIVHI
jgi:thymidine phosphorylase